MTAQHTNADLSSQVRRLYRGALERLDAGDLKIVHEAATMLQRIADDPACTGRISNPDTTTRLFAAACARELRTAVHAYRMGESAGYIRGLAHGADGAA